jgi:hypothetical protein
MKSYPNNIKNILIFISLVINITVSAQQDFSKRKYMKGFFIEKGYRIKEILKFSENNSKCTKNNETELAVTNTRIINERDKSKEYLTSFTNYQALCIDPTRASNDTKNQVIQSNINFRQQSKKRHNTYKKNPVSQYVKVAQLNSIRKIPTNLKTIKLKEVYKTTNTKNIENNLLKIFETLFYCVFLLALFSSIFCIKERLIIILGSTLIAYLIEYNIVSLPDIDSSNLYLFTKIFNCVAYIATLGYLLVLLYLSIGVAYFFALILLAGLCFWLLYLLSKTRNKFFERLLG